MSKTIIIHRHISFAQAANTDDDVKEYFGQAFKAVGPYWKGRVVGTGLTVVEQRLLMPYLHGVEPTDKDFRKSTELFFHEINTKIPSGGLKLEIGLEDETLPISETNLPLAIKDFVAYRHAIGHPKMAPSLDDAERSAGTAAFYIQDPNKIVNTSLKLNDLEDQALAVYFKYKDDETKVDQILTLFGVSTREKTTSDKLLEFKRLGQRKPEKGDVEQEQLLHKFITVCNDPDLLVKYLIQEMIGAQVLEKQGQTYFFKEEGRAIGASLKETVAYLKNPKNSRDYNVLRAHYETISKKGASLPSIHETELPVGIDPAPERGRKAPKPIVD